ncbi:hypothetical protein OHB26_09265 [Nocardia sp. NBC_01503]|uniref:DUF6779 domain-containing protein n=1 Tax=Nocardia sp. NBC_01503 TaxID=2975997 RepID=UPI002E7B01A8|nr:DUF6779 domain-containing protein [Nocardia sp. NBC_01503]WTL34366.1 hypothetical protein OHB26_09265 [Nocardia sp. NBC_01503]
MVSPSRSSASRRRREDAGKFFTGLLLLLGLVASVFLVFSDNVHMIRVGLVAALWAAAIGALAATRYRRESATDKAKVGDLQKVYQLQLEREVAARREYELGVETRVRKEVGADAEEMAALRAELTVLRESLQRLFDGDLPGERPALRADAVRVQELPASNGNSANGSANGNWEDTDSWDPWSTPVEPIEQDLGSRITPVFDADHPEPPAFASPFDDPVTAETSIVTESIDRLRVPHHPADRSREYEPPHDFEHLRPFEADFATENGAPQDDSRDDVDAARAAADALRSGSGTAAQPIPRLGDAARTKRTEPLTGLEREELQQVPWFETDLRPAGNAPKAATAEDAASGEAAANPRLAPPIAPAQPMGTASSRRRRRSDEDAGDDSTRRLSVAEIMANLRSEGGR